MKRVRAWYLVLATVSLAAHAATYVLSSPPRGTRTSETAFYAPVAKFLSEQTGQNIVYQYPGNWLTYTQNMRLGKYDLMFDGPQFVSWRIQHLDAAPLVKLPQPHVWVILRKAGDHVLTDVTSLVGHTVCAPPPPNFGTLVLQSLFQDPMAQPVIVPTKGWKNGFNGVLKGVCEATILPETNDHEFDPSMAKEKIIYQSRVYPNQAITASSRMPATLQQGIQKALLSPAGQRVLGPLSARYAKGRTFVVANRNEYQGVDKILKSYYVFSR